MYKFYNYEVLPRTIYTNYALDNVIYFKQNKSYNYNFSTHIKHKTGKVKYVYGADVYFDTIWIEPRTIDKLLITSNKSFQFLIWNKYLINKKNVNINNIVKTGVSTEYITPDILNKIFEPNKYLYFDFIIPLFGNVEFKITFTFEDTNNNISESIHLNGIRAIIIPIIPTKYEEQISFNVAIAKTRNFKEQRKITSDRINLTLKFEKDVNDIQLNKLMSLIEQGQGLNCILPIVSETFTAQIQRNQTSIVVNENLNDYKYIDYFNNYLLIIDKNDERKYEMKEIITIDKNTNTFVVSEPIINDYVNPIIYLATYFIISNITSTPLNVKKNRLSFEAIGYVI